MAGEKSILALSKKVTQGQIINYAEVSKDFNPVHWDEGFAKKSQFGRPIAHGMLVLAFVSEMMTHAYGKSWLDSGKLKVRFKEPVFPGNLVEIFGRESHRSILNGHTVVQWTVGCKNSDGREVISGTAEVRILNLDIGDKE